ncbi:hypothetical protein Pmani_033443 [Petrolisthes manimaculis]|uniref:Uncharacterized protein n=1 Tax=Petrolisthes manimaculis TaxID=1843537 RepID=A0AAE1NPH8_9EUCA|nr:hypothetical protein Pmani_038532 [Petrolisthes manimaculis]KAK4293895.1 hypothetical protein Pmani_033443 [Petrolisthes manimaculis]
MEGYAAPMMRAINAIKENYADDDSEAFFSEANSTMGSSNTNMHRDVGGQRRKEIKQSKVKNREADEAFNLTRSEELKAKYKK